MKKTVALLSALCALLSLATSHAATTKCKCARQPFKPDPPCVKKCVTGLLAIASRDDLTTLFALDAATVEAILGQQDRLSNIDQDITESLTDAQKRSVAEAFTRITESDLRIFIGIKETRINDSPFLDEVSLGSDKRRLRGTLAIREDLDNVLDARPLNGAILVLTGRDSDLRIGAVSVSSDRIAPSIVARWDDKILFTPNSSELTAEAKSTLDVFSRIVEMMSSFSRIEIQGHVNETDSKIYRELLALKRAEEVRDYLYLRHGIALAQIKVVACDQMKPEANNCFSDTQSQRRRVTLLVLE